MRKEAERLLLQARRDLSNGVPYEMYDQTIAAQKVAAAAEIAAWAEAQIR